MGNPTQIIRTINFPIRLRVQTLRYGKWARANIPENVGTQSRSDNTTAASSVSLTLDSLLHPPPKIYPSPEMFLSYERYIYLCIGNTDIICILPPFVRCIPLQAPCAARVSLEIPFSLLSVETQAPLPRYKSNWKAAKLCFSFAFVIVSSDAVNIICSVLTVAASQFCDLF